MARAGVIDTKKNRLYALSISSMKGNLVNHTHCLIVAWTNEEAQVAANKFVFEYYPPADGYTKQQCGIIRDISDLAKNFADGKSINEPRPI